MDSKIFPQQQLYDEPGVKNTMVPNWLSARSEVCPVMDFNVQEPLSRALLNHLCVGVFWKDADLVYRGCNERFAELSGLENPEAVEGRNDLELFGDADRARKCREIDARVLVEGRSATDYPVFQKSDGETVSMRVDIHPLFGSSGIAEGLLGIVEDRTDQVRSERKIDFAINHDPLTGLPTRQTLERGLKQATYGSAAARSQLGLLVVDLYHFKNVNILHGPTVGDRTLIEVANRLSCGLRKYDQVARMGADCFAILISDTKSVEDLRGVGDKVLHLLRAPFLIDGKEIRLQGNIGISRWDEKDGDAEAMVQRAFMALDEAVKLGPGTHHLYRPELGGRQSELLRMNERLHCALERGDLSVHYQPQVDIHLGRVVGAEALLRWNDSVFGAVSPADFITLAEESGQIIPIGEWVLRQVCEQIMAWRQQDVQIRRVWVNLSAKQIQEPFLVEVVRDILAETGLDSSALGLEITESVLVEDVERAAETLGLLKKLGVMIAVDDFGTGYSSLSYLKHFPIDVLKIDRSFVSDISGGRNGAMMAKAIITMAQALDLKVLAEGVENAAQVQLLQALGCTRMQGFKFGRPMPASEFRDYVVGQDNQPLDSFTAQHP